MSVALGRRWAAALVATLLLAAAGAGSARAGQIVYPSGTGIWVMNDDGSGSRELVDATQVPGMEFLGDPSVQPNGNEVAFVARWNQASAEQNAFTPASPGFCGGNCEGIYELRNGGVTRISPAPFACGGQPCESQEVDPRIGSDGRVAYTFKTYVSELNYTSWTPVTGQSALLSRDAGGGNQLEYKTACAGTSLAGRPVTDADALAVDPTNSSRIVYANCAEVVEDGVCPGGFITGYDIFDSGANPGTAADDKLVHTFADPAAECLRDANTQISDLDLSPDGSHVAEINGGAGAGLWTMATSGGEATQLLAIPSKWLFFSPRYIGPNEIALSAGPSPSQISIYTVPTSCTPASCDVSTGAGVHDLTGSRHLSSDYILATAGFGYTTSNAPIAAVGAGVSGTGGNGGGGSAGTGGTVTLAPIARQHVGTLLAGGLPFTVRCTAPCVVSASLRLGRTVLGTSSGYASGARTLRLRLSARGRSRLRHVRSATLTLRLVTRDSTAHARTLTRTFRVTR
jgi:hypothetical protein